MNLLAAGGFVSWAGQSDAFLAQFHLMGLLAALGIHALTSVLVGLLYGAMLPMFPRKPILTAGFIAPLLWTGILYSALGVISPILNERIDWLWFVVSQIAFGLVCGFVVNLQVKVRTPQFQSLAVLPFAPVCMATSPFRSIPRKTDRGVKRTINRAACSIRTVLAHSCCPRPARLGIGCGRMHRASRDRAPRSYVPNRCSTFPLSTNRTAPHATERTAGTARLSRLPIRSILQWPERTSCATRLPMAFPAS